MHVLLMPSWYPTEAGPVSGIFFRDQALALVSAGVRTGVVFTEQRTLRSLSPRALSENHWQLSDRAVDQVAEIRRHGWSLVPRSFSRRLWVNSMVGLGRTYVSRYGKPDILHVHSCVSAALPAHTLSQELGLPFVVTEHRTHFLQNQWRPPEPERTRAALRAAAAVCAVSSALAGAVERFAPGIACQVIPNLVDTDYFATVASLPRRPDQFRILTACILTRKKGVDNLIRAFSSAFPNDAEARLIIAGDGPERSLLEKLVKSLRLSDRVEFLGMLDRHRLRQEMGRATIFALASHIETFGVVIIEALSAGLPVIATRCGGPEDILTRDTGWLVTPGVQDELTAALREARIAIRGIDRSALVGFARERYSRQIMVSRLHGLYACAA